ncbi:MAG: PEP-CTERM sorting domain-containing protein [Methyloversatilis sp.]|jgi:hypothetical protein|nr:PEP-CTERM sorting domain-containing protein [Methyloversatilis sp.]
MKARTWIAVGMLALTVALPAQAVTVVDFENVFQLEDGYGGLSGWNELGSLNSGALPGEQRFHGGTGSLTFDQGGVRLLGMDFVTWTGDLMGGFRLFNDGVQVYEYMQAEWLNDPYWLDIPYAGPVDRIDFISSSDGFLMDNLTYTAAVPEPGQLALMLGGLALTGLVAHRRSAATGTRR